MAIQSPIPIIKTRFIFIIYMAALTANRFNTSWCQGQYMDGFQGEC